MNVFSDIQFNVKLHKLRFCKYKLTIAEKDIELSFPQLLALRNRVNEYTSAQRLEDIVQNENFVLLFVADRKHLIYLEVPQLLDLKEEISLYFYNY